MNLLAVFLTGLTTGALTCLAVQGGLLTSIIANQKDLELDRKAKTLNHFDVNDLLPVGFFLVTKLGVHVVLGFLLGALGSVMTLSLPVKVAFQVFTALFMFATAMNLLDVHPVFRYVVIQPPRFITRRISKLRKKQDLFAPAILGLFTVFIPCGVTQAMEVVAINSGDPVQGALIMGAFVLGTSPLFALIGLATAKLSELWRERFLKVAAYVLIGMALYTLNGVLQVADAPISVQKIISIYQRVQQYESGEVAGAVNELPIVEGRQQVKIDVQSSGYQPTYVRVKKDVPVEMTLSSHETYSCAVAFVFKEFRIKTMLGPTDTQSFTFIPTKTGRFTYSCSMGMYSGVMEVI